MEDGRPDFDQEWRRRDEKHVGDIIYKNDLPLKRRKLSFPSSFPVLSSPLKTPASPCFGISDVSASTSYSPAFPPLSVSRLVEDVPKVVSSAHLNELVAMYSQPALLVPQRPPCGVFEPDDSTCMRPRFSDWPPALHHASSPAAGSPWLSDHSEDGRWESMEAVDAVFDGLESIMDTGEPGGAGEGGASGRLSAPLLTEGLALGDETRRTVEKWLRDPSSNRLSQTEVPGCLAVEEDDSCLPRWVLDELGETDPCHEDPCQDWELTRADSHSSSTNGSAVCCREGPGAEVTSYTAGALQGNPGCTAEMDCNDVSALPVEQEVREERVADSQARDSLDTAGSLLMSRSFSSSWMKDLLDGGDSFLLDAALHTGQLIPAPEGTSCPLWLDKQ